MKTTHRLAYRWSQGGIFSIEGHSSHMTLACLCLFYSSLLYFCQVDGNKQSGSTHTHIHIHTIFPLSPLSLANSSIFAIWLWNADYLAFTIQKFRSQLGNEIWGLFVCNNIFFFCREFSLFYYLVIEKPLRSSSNIFHPVSMTPSPATLFSTSHSSYCVIWVFWCLSCPGYDGGHMKRMTKIASVLCQLHQNLVPWEPPVKQSYFSMTIDVHTGKHHRFHQDDTGAAFSTSSC